MSDASELVVASAFLLPLEAHLAWSVLDAAGVEAQVHDEYVVRADWLLCHAVGGVKVVVRAEDLTTACELLETTAVVLDDDALLQLSGAEDREQDVCPRCGSPAWGWVTFGRRAAALTWVIVGLPLYAVRRRLQCGHCGHVAR
jgi:hypothetical protein